MDRWKVVKTSTTSNLVIAKFSGDGYTITWSEVDPADGCLVGCKGWFQKCNSDDFMVFNSLYNPNVEGAFSVLVKKLSKAVFESEATQFEVVGDREQDERTITLASAFSVSSSLCFNWRFDCSLMSDKDFCDTFVKPIYKLTTIISCQNELLRKMLRKKDQEIAEHRANGSIIKRTHLETTPFDQDEFEKESLRDETIPKNLSSCLGSLLGSDSVKKLLSLLDNKEAFAPPKDSPVRKSPPKKKSTVTPADVVDEPVVQPSDEHELEMKKRAKIQSLRSVPKTKKKKTKSVF